MKQIRTFLLAILTAGTAAVYGQTDIKETLTKAEQCYAAQDYRCAADGFKSAVDAGNASSQLYYNLANAHFKLGNIAYSILYYEKALVLAPADEEITANLQIARSHQVDKIEILPEFVLTTWFRSIAGWMSSDGWAYLAVSLFALFIGSLSLYIFSATPDYRKIGFFAAFAFLVFFGTSAYMASWRKSEILSSGMAIIINASVTIKSAPDSTGTDLMVVHEGMKVQTFNVVGDWTEVKLPDGSVGWMMTADFAAI